MERDERERERKPRVRRPHHLNCGAGTAIEDDGAIGAWAKEELQEMQERFAQAIAREVRPKR
jgi:hypothetical protein